MNNERAIEIQKIQEKAAKMVAKYVKNRKIKPSLSVMQSLTYYAQIGMGVKHDEIIQ